MQFVLMIIAVLGCIPPCEVLDSDEDGFLSWEQCEVLSDPSYHADPDDCDDNDADINPDAEEVVDGVDNDCDGDVDEDVIT